MDKPVCKIRLSKYLDCIVVLLIIALVAANLKMVQITIADLKAFPPENSILLESFKLLLPSLLSSTLVIFLCLTRDECFGHVKLYDDRIELHSSLKRKRVLFFLDIKFCGIAYAVINHDKQFWIYFSTQKIPSKYLTRMNRLKITENTIKIQFDAKTFDTLINHIPKPLSKQLSASYSVIRLNKQN